MPSNLPPIMIWKRQPQADGSVIWWLYHLIKRTPYFVERPAHVCDRYHCDKAYVLLGAGMRGTASGGRCALEIGGYKTLALAKHHAEQAWMDDKKM